ncbi:MAG: GGDEF domain-containing protein [Gemmatimonadales bacterium]|nr:MAG: GGDEF domain-containing protein [Gemmatimonadales bacterium]
METSSPTLAEILGSDRLPSAPTVAVRLLDLLQDPEVGTPEIVAVIRTDPALAARILRAANSSYFAFRSEVGTLEQGVPLIGRSVITSLALSFFLAEEAMSHGALSEDFRRFWVRSLVQGASAELLAKHGAPGLAAELFVSALLMDLGQLAFLKVVGREYAELQREAGPSGRDICVAEVERYGFSHPQVGAELMRRWSLPESMVRACLLHHQDDREGPSLLKAEEKADEFGSDQLRSDAEGDALVRVMQVASAVGDWYGGGAPAEELARLAELTETHFGFSEETLLRYLMEMDDRIAETSSLFPTRPPNLPSAADLMARASEQLAEVAIEQERERARMATLKELAEERRAELEAQNEVLRRQVFMDPLTGVHNRRFFDEMLRHEALRAARNGLPVSLLFVDLDHFKNVNDKHGHIFGDEVLAAVGRALRQAVRRSDLVARFGGEEFVVLALETDERGLGTLGERIRRSVEELALEAEGEPVPITVSVGAASLTRGASEERDLDRLLESADKAMYRSKEGGRNRVTVLPLASGSSRSPSGDPQGGGAPWSEEEPRDREGKGGDRVESVGSQKGESGADPPPSAGEGGGWLAEWLRKRRE